MKKSAEIDLADLTDILEGFVKKLDKMSQADLIDLAARLKPVAKHCEAIDKLVKEMVKVELDHSAGELPGSLFKAVLAVFPVTRLDQTALKEAKPTIYASFLKPSADERVTFSLR